MSRFANRPSDEWVRPRGSVTVSVAGASSGTIAVTFPTGRFPAPPVVLVSKQGAALSKFHAYATSITATGCTIGVQSGDAGTATGDVVVAWMAVDA